MSSQRVPEQVADVLDRFAAVARAGTGALALYGAGSLATGDFRPDVSDLDLVAVVPRPLTSAQRRLLAGQHRRLAAEHLAAAKLHCAYVAVPEIDDLATKHATWAHGRFLPRIVNAVSRAELQASGLVVFGPPPGELIPLVDADDVAAAARFELTTIWRPATRRLWLWWQDVWVDVGLTTVVRAHAAVIDGSLLTKSAAIERLASFGAPPGLVHEIARRRQGEQVLLSGRERAARAVLVRRLVATGIDRVLAVGPP